MIEKYRLHNLHAIRGWAALFVVIAHTKYPFWSGGRAYLEQYPMDTWIWYQYFIFGLDMITSFGSIFVITFFVLSGFFITRSLKNKHYSIPFFYGDRMIRIFIPYIGSLFLGFIFLHIANYIHPELFKMFELNRPYNSNLISSYNDLNIHSFFMALIFSPGEEGYFAMNGAYWSLYHEALFYFIIPFILLFLKKYTYFIIGLVLFIISFFYGGNWVTIKAFVFSYSLYFATGVLLYELTNTKGTRYYIIKYIRKFTNLVLSISIVMMLFGIILGLLNLKKYGFFLGMFATALLILLVLYGKNTKIFFFFKKLLINKFSNFLGKISFSLYLVHIPLLVVYYSIWTKYSEEFIFYDRIYWIVVICIIPFGYLFYFFIEKRSLIILEKYKKKYSNTKK